MTECQPGKGPWGRRVQGQSSASPRRAPLSSHIWGNILIDPRTLPQAAQNCSQQRPPQGSIHHQSTQIRAQDAPEPNAVRQADGKAQRTGRELAACLTNALLLFCGLPVSWAGRHASLAEALMMRHCGYSEKRNRRSVHLRARQTPALLGPPARATASSRGRGKRRLEAPKLPGQAGLERRLDAVWTVGSWKRC